MRFSQFAGLAALTVQSLIGGSFAQRSYTEPNTGLTFWVEDVPSTQTVGGYSHGYVVPSGTNPTYEYVGIMIGGLVDGAGWSGISHSGPMTNGLLLMAWPYEDEIVSSFRYATGYVPPDLYTGNATATTIYSSVNSTNFVWIYRCEWCFTWDQNGAIGSQPTTQFQVLGWAQNKELPDDPANPDSSAGTLQHDNGESLYGIDPSSAVYSDYSSWVSAHVSTPAPTATATNTATTTSATATATTTYTGLPVPTASYDYIVVGSGAGGIPIADKLSEAGKKVLLIERGPPSSNRWGGYLRPDWLAGSNLSRFDVPGLDNEIWVDSAGIACSDVDQMAGCVLGGGTAVNAGLWWKPNTVDWDYNFPTGWKSTDMSAATSRVFSRIPGTDHPSLDGKIYLPQGYNVVGGGLAAAGWANVTANDVPNQKSKVFAHTPYMYSHGERGGPMATYLVSAHGRSNFAMWTNTTVSKVIRNGAQITGVQVQAYGPDGYTGIVNVTASTGRVILSAGTFNTPKILYRSGIGPTAQLNTVAASTSDGATMVASSQWLNLPVGQNLVEQTNTDCVISHPDVVFYDFYAAYDTPNATDRDLYLNQRSGILAQSAPNIGPMFWDTVAGADGITRQLQWTARVEGSLGAENGNTMTLSQYLGRGTTSRGAITISPNLDISVSTLPFLQTADDVAAVIQGITNLQNALANVKNLTWISPAPGQNATDYVNNYVISASGRRSNHWMGTCKMGTDSGLTGGTSVVDTNTKVYGTNNLFVVDASIFPGQVTTNPSAYIVTVAERAAERILALAASGGSSSSSTSSTTAKPTTTTAKTTSASATKTTSSTVATATHYGQCGGTGYTGPTQCASPYTCQYQNDYYSQCI